MVEDGVEIWHNPRCSKSRQTLALLEERGLSPKIVKYLDDPPSIERLRAVAGMMGSVGSLVRRKEKVFGELELQNATDAELLAALSETPALIERPVVITARGARIGRPPENVLEILK